MLTTCRIFRGILISTPTSVPQLAVSQHFHCIEASYNSNPVLFPCRLEVNLGSLSFVRAEWSVRCLCLYIPPLCTAGFAFLRDSHATISSFTAAVQWWIVELIGGGRHCDLCDDYLSNSNLKCTVYIFRFWRWGLLKLRPSQFWHPWLSHQILNW
jgi:hypothetical protein